eukprot:3515779-Pyramimonas_sp.AAC.1
MPALSSIYNDKNGITCVFCTHVDDIMWAADDGSQERIDSVLAELDPREMKADTFRHCGWEVVQDEGFA